jgi:ribosomal protein S18 acetylase RimI-like enzyme
MDFTVREARLEDMPALLKMGKGLISYLNRLEKKRRQTNLMAIDHQNAEKAWRKYYTQAIKSNKALFLVALKGKSLIGMAFGKLETSPPVFKLKEFGEIHEVFIEAPYRNKKVAKNLIKKLEEFFKEKGVSLIQMKAESFNSEAIAAYYKLGYADSRKTLYKEI